MPRHCTKSWCPYNATEQYIEGGSYGSLRFKIRAGASLSTLLSLITSVRANIYSAYTIVSNNAAVYTVPQVCIFSPHKCVPLFTFLSKWKGIFLFHFLPFGHHLFLSHSIRNPFLFISCPLHLFSIPFGHLLFLSHSFPNPFLSISCPLN